MWTGICSAVCPDVKQSFATGTGLGRFTGIFGKRELAKQCKIAGDDIPPEPSHVEGSESLWRAGLESDRSGAVSTRIAQLAPFAYSDSSAWFGREFVVEIFLLPFCGGGGSVRVERIAVLPLDSARV